MQCRDCCFQRLGIAALTRLRGRVGRRLRCSRLSRRQRWLGNRPHVRGVVMNPVDHPHGGGEGKTSGGRHPVSPWGLPTKGYKTRNNKSTDRFIVQRRPKGVR